MIHSQGILTRKANLERRAKHLQHLVRRVMGRWQEDVRDPLPKAVPFGFVFGAWVFHCAAAPQNLPCAI